MNDTAISPDRPSRFVAAKVRVARLLGRAQRPLLELPTLPTQPMLPTLDEHGNVIHSGEMSVGGSAAATSGAAGVATSIEEVRAFLYREARLLDERRWDDWLALWAPDARYAMPTRRSVMPTKPDRPTADERTPEGGAWWFDEGLQQLEMRVAKLKTGKAWAEEPPSRTRRTVSNVEWDAMAGVARSNALIYRGRRDADVEWFSCGRVDHLVVVGGRLRLASRIVTVDENVVAGDNLTLFL